MATEFELPKGGINKQVHDFILSRVDLKGKKVLDCPAGDGRTSYVLKKMGAEVVSADLFPDFFKLDGQNCLEVNLNNPLPFADNEFDFIVNEEVALPPVLPLYFASESDPFYFLLKETQKYL